VDSLISNPEIENKRRRENHHNHDDNNKDDDTLRLRQENEKLKLKIKELKLNSKRVKQRVKQAWGASSIFLEEAKNEVIENIQHKQTSEENHSYYGPTSTQYMIRDISADCLLTESNVFKNPIQNLNKLGLPMLLGPQYLFTKSIKNLMKKNIEVMIILLKKFIHLRVHYTNYIDVKSLIEFLENYDTMKEWNDEFTSKLLLIIMIVIVTLRSLPQFDSIRKEFKLSYEKLHPILYTHYLSIKSKFDITTVTALKAGLLEAEDLFYNKQIEKCWSLFFQIICKSYSLGLYVYDDSIVEELKNPILNSPCEVVRKNDRFSLWLVINFVSSTLCSVLGRPNPVKFHYTPLLANYEINLNYKISLAELIKKSTSLLIDSYKMQINEDLVNKIDSSFVQNSMIYENILFKTQEIRETTKNKFSKKFITLPIPFPMEEINNGNNIEPFPVCPLDIRFSILEPCQLSNKEEAYCMIQEDADTLCDLILLYANRAKFNQHFMKIYPKSLVNAIVSATKVLEYAVTLIILLMKKMKSPNFEELYPFVHVFFYQTFVVICTIFYQDFNILKPCYNDLNTLKIKIANFVDIYGDHVFNEKLGRLIQYIYKQSDQFYIEYCKSDAKRQSLDVENLALRNQLILTDVPTDILVDNTEKITSSNADQNAFNYAHSKNSNLSHLLNFNDLDPTTSANPIRPVDSTTPDSSLHHLLEFDLEDPFFIQNPTNFA
jgi:hypothetical protein